MNFEEKLQLAIELRNYEKSVNNLAIEERSTQEFLDLIANIPMSLSIECEPLQTLSTQEEIRKYYPKAKIIIRTKYNWIIASQDERE